MTAADTTTRTRWMVSFGLVTLEVEVEADTDDEARAEGRESLRQAIETDLAPDNLVVERIR